jgi:hypothetical protein
MGVVEVFLPIQNGAVGERKTGEGGEVEGGINERLARGEKGRGVGRGRRMGKR